MYIKKLQLLNFQVIESFEADFDGNVYFITGDNELGKSTLLKAIGALLTGQRDEVLRNGASKGFAKMIVGDDGEEYDVSLSFTEANPRGTLTIKQKTTGMQTNNVSMLSRIFGYQDFDAVEFSRWSETAEGRRKQIAVVKSLLPESVRNRIDTIDARVSELKDTRTDVNREIKRLTIEAEKYKDISQEDVEKYVEPIDLTDLLERQRTAAALVEKAKTVRSMLAQRIEQLQTLNNDIDAENRRKEREDADIEAQVAAAKAAYEQAIANAGKAHRENAEFHENELASIESKRKDLEERKKNAEQWLAKYEENDPEKADFSGEIERAKAYEQKYQLVRQYRESKAALNNAVSNADAMNNELSELATERARLVTEAKLPIEGLTFTDDGLELNGIPFTPGKVSDSQIMECAAKLIIASNPTVKVFRIARGESLGAKRLQTIVEIAKRNGFQGFIEQVKRGQTEMMVEEYTEDND